MSDTATPAGQTPDAPDAGSDGGAQAAAKGGNPANGAKATKGAKATNDKKAAKQGKKSNAASGDAISLANHPRAAAQIRRAKGWGGLAGFVLAAYLSLSANVAFDQAGLRAIAAGVAGYVVGWACSVTVWRHLVVAEMRAAAERARSAREGAAQGDSVAKPPAPATP
jgi:hypothetical protein